MNPAQVVALFGERPPEAPVSTWEADFRETWRARGYSAAEVEAKWRSWRRQQQAVEQQRRRR